MDFLALINRTRQECGASGGDLANFSALSKDSTRFKNWVASAWEEIQMMRTDWMWMRGDFSFALTTSDGRYSAADAGIASRFLQWDKLSFRIYQTALGISDEIELPYLPYEDFRAVYDTGPQTDSRPLHASIAPNLDLLIGHKPDATGYTVRGEYFKSIQSLSLTTDTPEMPAQFHMAIVYRAMQKYARYDAAPEIYTDAERNERFFIDKLELNQGGEFVFAGTLCE